MTRDNRLAIAWKFYNNDPFLKKHALTRHECDPFVPVIELEEGVYCFPHYSPDQIAASNCYLVCGTERALLIDTAYGIGDLSALCAELTDKPVTLVNTHYHGDHTGGNSRFGSCHMHILDAEKPEMLRKPQPVTIIEKNPDNFYTLEDVAAPGRGTVIPVSNGHIFDLGGGYEIEVIHLPGHTSGSIALLDRRRSLLFTGDALMSQPCSTMIVSFAGTSDDSNTTIQTFRDALIPLRSRMSEIRALCPGHCDILTSPTLIPDMLACCEDILKSPDIGGEARFRAGARMHIHGTASITYTHSHIYK